MKDLGLEMRSENRHQLNKKGFLLGEFSLKLILSIIGLLILIGLLFMLYDSFASEDKTKAAKASLEKIESMINGITAQTPTQTDILLSPKGWMLLNYPKGGPIECYGASCLCICSEDVVGGYVDECNKEGKCLVFDQKVIELRDKNNNRLDLIEIEETEIEISLSKGVIYTIKSLNV